MTMRPLAMMVVVAAGVTVSAAQAPQTVFRSGVDLVRFDVRVTDGNGRPLADLKPDEIQIVEDGRARPLLLFQHIDEPAGSYTDAAVRAVTAEVTTNQGMPRGHLYILVFDQQHITSGNEQIARRAAEQFIASRVRPSDRVAIVGLPGPGPELNFTADRQRAVAELQKVRGALDRTAQTAMGRISVQEAYEIANGNDRITTDVLTRYSSDPTADVSAATATQTLGQIRANSGDDPSVTRRLIIENARALVATSDSEARQFLQRLMDLIEQYRAIEGRKTVVLFSEGFHQQNVTRELEQVEAAAAQSYAVFYSFDLNRRRSEIDQQALPATDQAMEIQQRAEPLGSLAAETDGVLVTDAASHLDTALQRIADQAQDYYLVGFAPSEAALASRGAYRRVSVRVTRPGARVSARTGYALPRDPAPLDRRRAVDAALAAPFVQQALKIDYTTYVLRSEDTSRARVVLSLDADLPVAAPSHDTADVVFVVRDTRDGRVVASGTDTMKLPASAAPNAATGHSTYRVQFEVPPGPYIMRAVVREPGGLVGSADRRLDVRSLAGPDVSVSDVILGSPNGALPVRTEAYVHDGVEGMIEAYGRSPEQLQNLTVTASLVPAGSEQAIETVRADIAEGATTSGGVMRRAMFLLPLANAAPGAYLARVHVTAGGEPIADLTREVDVRPGAAPVAPAGSTPTETALRPADVLNGDFVRRSVAAAHEGSTPVAVRAASGFDLFAAGKYAEAAADLAQALKMDQSNAAVAFVLGWAWEGAGDHRQAIGAWRAAAAINPKMVPAHLALADAYLKLAQPALAVQALKAGLTALPDSVELRAKLAQLEKKM